MPDPMSVRAEQRLDCLRTGIRLGDAVGDLQWVLQEVGEHDSSTEQGRAADDELSAIVHGLDDDVAKAHRECGLSEEVVERWIRFGELRQSGDLDGMRSAAVELSDFLAKGGGGES